MTEWICCFFGFLNTYRYPHFKKYYIQNITCKNSNLNSFLIYCGLKNSEFWFFSKPKNLIFGPFWELSRPSWPTEIFFQKLGFVTFLTLRQSNFMQKIWKKNWWTNSDILVCGRTNRRTENTSSLEGVRKMLLWRGWVSTRVRLLQS